MRLTRTHLLLSLTFLGATVLFAPAPLHAQPSPVRPAQWGPAPLLYVRIAGPAGAQATFYEGSASRSFPVPVTVGVRAGYITRFKLDHLPGRPGVALYPTIEVHGTLQLPPTLQAAAYPAPAPFTDRDITTAVQGDLITRLIVLENPEHALSEPATVDVPTEIAALTENLVAEVRDLGRPLAIVRLGGRDYTDDEAAAEAIPGTLLLPGQTVLGAPACRPVVSLWPPALYDPRLGPAPSEAECLRDGGDVGWRAGLDPDGHIRGLEPSNTVAAYTDAQGRHLTPSNRICICVPRFIILRRETVVVPAQASITIGRAKSVIGEQNLKGRMASVAILNREHPEGMHGRERPSAIVAPEVLGRVQVTGRVAGVTVVGKVAETENTIPTKEVHLAPGRLVLHKWASTTSAHVGDIVTIYLKYSNMGGEPITDVAVADSLTGRLEYIPGSAKADRDAVLTIQSNEAGSVILHWDVRGTLLPNSSGVISFRVRVR